MCHGQVGNAEVYSNRDACTQRKIHLWKGVFPPCIFFFVVLFLHEASAAQEFPPAPITSNWSQTTDDAPIFRHFFSKGVVTLVNPFLHSGPLHPLPGPQSQGVVSPPSPIDFFFLPPMENFLCIKWQRKCLIKEEQPDLAVLQDRRWLFSI